MKNLSHFRMHENYSESNEFVSRRTYQWMAWWKIKDLFNARLAEWIQKFSRCLNFTTDLIRTFGIKMQECSLDLCAYTVCGRENNIKDMELNIKHMRFFPSVTGLHEMCDKYLITCMPRKLYVTRTPNCY